MHGAAVCAYLLLLAVLCLSSATHSNPRPAVASKTGPACYPLPRFTSRGPSGPIRAASRYEPSRVIYHKPVSVPTPECQLATLHPSLRHYGKTAQRYDSTVVYYSVSGNTRRPLVMRRYYDCIGGTPPSPGECDRYSFTYFNGGAPSVYAIVNASLVAPVAHPMPRHFEFEIGIGRSLHRGAITVGAGAPNSTCGKTPCGTSFEWVQVPRCLLGVANAVYNRTTASQRARAVGSERNDTAGPEDFSRVSSASQSILAAAAEAGSRDIARGTRRHRKNLERPERKVPLVLDPSISKLMRMERSVGRHLLSVNSELIISGDGDSNSTEANATSTSDSAPTTPFPPNSSDLSSTSTSSATQTRSMTQTPSSTSPVSTTAVSTIFMHHSSSPLEEEASGDSSSTTPYPSEVVSRTSIATLEELESTESDVATPHYQDDSMTSTKTMEAHDSAYPESPGPYGPGGDVPTNPTPNFYDWPEPTPEYSEMYTPPDEPHNDAQPKPGDPETELELEDYVPGNVEQPFELPKQPPPQPPSEPPAKPQMHVPLFPFLTSSPTLDIAFVISATAHIASIIIILVLAWVLCSARARVERNRYFAARYAHVPLQDY
uniref:Glycoprotein G n=1 Tax=Bovine alphaherpesvirus 2 TaxID=10295 RepID=Q9QPU9_9ALPH|nr:glycoprotein G [Bovine alphaherpesvirus 2]